MTTSLPHLTHALFTQPTPSILLPIALGTGIGYSTRPTQTKKTYLSMKQPPLRPPPWVFGPVWTALYGLMGYAAHRAYTLSLPPSLSSHPPTPTPTSPIPLLYTLQLSLNLAWMPLFFTLRRPGLALLDIGALVGLNSYLAYRYFAIDSLAGWCVVPYLAWLGFATYLNAGVGYLNRWDISESTLATREALGKRE
ncbi:TspO/MBR-related protein [Camillea tinctor]|nr:TspO/MBR-related protein [Camillea tinctor]